jgi:chaperonin cofactor prefoldin
MYTINDLRKALGLTTNNQVRNRIDAIKDLLYPHLRRGPNNQILVADAGLVLLRQLQELHDSGLRINEASSVMNTNAEIKDIAAHDTQARLTSNQVIPGDCTRLVAALQEEIAFLRKRVEFLENRDANTESQASRKLWWEALRGEIGGA